MGTGEDMDNLLFITLRDGTEIEFDDFTCSKCTTKAEDMSEEANTVLICPCGERFYINIWDDDNTLRKRHPEKYK